jgi:formylglycine-generating enzyme required for sulfatase activity
MVYVPEGEFLMGSTDAEVAMAISQCEIDQGVGNCEQMGFDAQMPQHAVMLDAFWIDQTEVTNAQFADFLNVRGNQVEEGVPWLEIDDDYALVELRGDTYRPIEGYADHPVIEVSWAGATAYCTWAGVRLPTEAEWEYVARGPQSLIYPWGDTFECQYGNFDDETQLDAYIVAGRAGCDGYIRTAPVGSFPSGKSWCGALDMAGNVWEWVQDWYATDYYKLSPYQNPPGPSMGEYRIGRGGSWWSSEAWLHSTTRLKISPTGAGYDLGFRCAMTSSQDR